MQKAQMRSFDWRINPCTRHPRAWDTVAAPLPVSLLSFQFCLTVKQIHGDCDQTQMRSQLLERASLSRGLKLAIRILGVPQNCCVLTTKSMWRVWHWWWWGSCELVRGYGCGCGWVVQVMDAKRLAEARAFARVDSDGIIVLGWPESRNEKDANRKGMVVGREESRDSCDMHTDTLSARSQRVCCHPANASC